MEYRDTCERIWRGYVNYASCASVIRKGYELVGAAISTDDALNLNSTFMRRSDSVLEHQAKTAWLASVFLSNFPDFFGKGITCETSPVVWVYITTALCHDVGELRMGDIPDDGNPLHDSKDDVELEVFQDFILAYNFFDRRRLFEMFKSFQKKDSYPAKALFALDKLEAVLTNLLLEKNGIYGDIKKKDNPTKRDLKYAGIASSNLAADVWGAQMLKRFEDFPPTITKPIYELLKIASRDVRGESFPWLKQ